MNPTLITTPALSPLTRRRLPAWTPYLSGLVAICLAVAVHWGRGWSGLVQVTGLALLLHLSAYWVLLRCVEGARATADKLFTIVISACLIATVAPLGAILAHIVVNGATALSLDFLTHSMHGVSGDAPGGGVFHAIVGTVQQVALATVIAVPIGVGCAIYLVEFGRGRFARWVTFIVDVMNGVPSIVAGLFVFSALLLGLGMRPFGAAGALALVILMLPIVIRAAEEMLRLVPQDLREASYALGASQWRTTMKVVVPTAFSGIVTGVLLAIARVAGETAPAVLLVGYSSQINRNPFSGDQAGLPMMIWDQLGKRSGEAGIYAEPRAWGAALVLVALIVVLNVGARLLTHRFSPLGAATTGRQLRLAPQRSRRGYRATPSQPVAPNTFAQ